MNESTSESPLATSFAQQIVPGSARFWSAHFAGEQTRDATRALWCFAHDMDGLSLASSEVVAEKSIWWHEELQRMAEGSPRHPTLLALLEHLPSECSAERVTHALHEHLHGALVTQQKALSPGLEGWEQYAYLRIGTLHTALSLFNLADAETAQALGRWAAQYHAAAVQLTPELYSDQRWLVPSPTDSISPTLNTDEPPAGMSAASAVLIGLEKRARERQLPSPLYTSEPQGLRGMLTAWRAARRSR